MNLIKKIIGKFTFKAFRSYVIDNQNRQQSEINSLKDQIFLSNPNLLFRGVQMHLPLFYVDHIQKCIYRERNFYEATTLEFLKREFHEFKNVLEIGANIGNHMLFYTTQMNAQSVRCFEPNAMSAATLRKNIELNHLKDKVTVFPVALGAGRSFGVQSNFDLANTGMNKIVTVASSAENTVEVHPLDSFEFSGIDFIKIDVEGFEMEVLSGAINTLKNNRPVVMVEVFEEKLSHVVDFFSRLNYKKSYVIEMHNLIFTPL